MGSLDDCFGGESLLVVNFSKRLKIVSAGGKWLILRSRETDSPSSPPAGGRGGRYVGSARNKSAMGKEGIEDVYLYHKALTLPTPVKMGPGFHLTHPSLHHTFVIHCLICDTIGQQAPFFSPRALAATVKQPPWIINDTFWPNMLEQIKDKIEVWWEERKQVRRLREASVPDVRHNPEEFDVPVEQIDQLAEEALARISDLESAREEIGLLYKLDVAGKGLSSERLHRLLDHYIGYLNQQKNLQGMDEWDDLLPELPSLQAAHIERILGFVSGCLNADEYVHSTFLLRSVEHPNCTDEALELAAQILSKFPGHYNNVLHRVEKVRTHPQVRTALFESGNVRHLQLLLQDGDAEEWKLVFEKLMELNPEFAIKQTTRFPPPDGTTLQREDLLPALSSDDPALRQHAVRVLEYVQQTEKPTGPTR